MARVEKKRITVTPATVGDYKNNPVLTLNPNANPSLSFGLGKAMLIMENIAAIGAFLKSDGKSVEISPELKAKLDIIAAEFLPKMGE